MESYRGIVHSLGISNPEVWLHTWKVQTLAKFAVFGVLAIFIIFIPDCMVGECHYLSCCIAVFLTIYVVLGYTYFRERKLTGWRMNTAANSLISSAPVTIPTTAFGLSLMLYYSLIYSSRIFYLTLAGMLLIFLIFLIHEVREGFRMEKVVKRIYNIPNLQEELFLRLKRAFPQAYIKGGVRIQGLSVRVENSWSRGSVGKVEISGLKEGNVDVVRKIMEIVDVLG